MTYFPSASTSHRDPTWKRGFLEHESEVNLSSPRLHYYSPLSKQSIPRLELLSGVILARLVSSVKETLEPKIQINETHLWLDSRTAIFWIKGSKEWKQFVQNSVSNWRINVEPLPRTWEPSRTKLKSNQLWWGGPWWLSEPKTNWPKSKECLEHITEECRTEVKKAHRMEATEEIVHLASTGRPDFEACIPITDFCEKSED